MINVRKFKFLRRKSIIGWLLRLPFNLISDNAVIKIPFGPLSGIKWIKGSHNLSVLLGTYERSQSRKFREASEGIQVFWDVGAHAGYYSLLFRSINHAGKVFAFEPMAKNATFFRRHMELNSVEGVRLVEKAVSDRDGILRFSSGKTSVAGKLSVDGDNEVEVVRISRLISDRIVELPQLIKMDIEGEEYKVLQDLIEWLKIHKPKMFLSTHGENIHKSCVALLSSIGYTISPLDSNDLSSCREMYAF